MAWLIKIDEAAKKELAKMDKAIARRIRDYLRDRIAKLDDPRDIGDALKGSELGGFWKYRVGDYRIIAKIEDNELRILFVQVSHRREVYR